MELLCASRAIGATRSHEDTRGGGIAAGNSGWPPYLAVGGRRPLAWDLVCYIGPADRPFQPTRAHLNGPGWRSSCRRRIGIRSSHSHPAQRHEGRQLVVPPLQDLPGQMVTPWSVTGLQMRGCVGARRIMRGADKGSLVCRRECSIQRPQIPRRLPLWPLQRGTIPAFVQYRSLALPQALYTAAVPRPVRFPTPDLCRRIPLIAHQPL